MTKENLIKKINQLRCDDNTTNYKELSLEELAIGLMKLDKRQLARVLFYALYQGYESWEYDYIDLKSLDFREYNCNVDIGKMKAQSIDFERCTANYIYQGYHNAGYINQSHHRVSGRIEQISHKARMVEQFGHEADIIWQNGYKAKRIIQYKNDVTVMSENAETLQYGAKKI